MAGSSTVRRSVRTGLGVVVDVGGVEGGRADGGGVEGVAFPLIGIVAFARSGSAAIHSFSCGSRNCPIRDRCQSIISASYACWDSDSCSES